MVQQNERLLEVIHIKSTDRSHERKERPEGKDKAKKGQPIDPGEVEAK
jgi:hypothetical protein